MEPTPVSLDQFRASLLEILGETFESVRGNYLEKGTSLFETLDGITAETASRAASPTRSSIAAHVEHVRFYMDVNQRSMRGEALGVIDWKESWKLQRVTAPEWQALKGHLRQAYTDLLAMVKGMDAWDRPEDISDALAILAHTAYHLGAIRQALGVVKA